MFCFAISSAALLFSANWLAFSFSFQSGCDVM